MGSARRRRHRHSVSAAIDPLEDEELIEVSFADPLSPADLDGIGIPTLPRSTRRTPDLVKVANYLTLRGWPVQVVFHPDFGCFSMNDDPRLEPPRAVWLEAMRYGGQDPLPCLPCFETGDGEECMAGRCTHRAGPDRR